MHFFCMFECTLHCKSHMLLLEDKVLKPKKLNIMFLYF